MADEILRQPSGIAMVMALLRYITRSAVKLNRAEMTGKLLTTQNSQTFDQALVAYLPPAESNQ